MEGLPQDVSLLTLHEHFFACAPLSAARREWATRSHEAPALER
jgi:hypothetical protein